MISIPSIYFSKTDCNTPFTLAVDKVENRPELVGSKDLFMTDFFEIIFLRKASGYVLINHKRVDLQDGMVLFISPNDSQSWHVDVNNTHGYFLIFKEEFIDQFVADSSFVFRLLYFYQSVNAPLLLLDEDNQQSYEAIVKSIKQELLFPVADSYNMVVAQFCLLLVKLNRQYAAEYNLPFSPPKANYAFIFKQLLETHIEEWQRVEDYADYLKISRISLNKYAVAQYGQTASEMIKVRLLKAVKNELIFANQSLAQIAEKYGFSESSHLARFFKQRSGMTTTEFVSAYQNGNL